uniref:Uncharacterized protein n=1 Tax=Timema poppense TaxID=170557 RepID=A0A7R9D133_TIMPO|nr:unnamed protein product [Timema poppensis]
MEGQDVCASKAKPVKPLAITSIFNTLFPLDVVDAKRVIVGMSVKNNFTPYVQLEKCGGNCAMFNRTEWQELGSYKSAISKFFSNTQPPQKISLTYHESSLRRLCGDRMVVISEIQDAVLRRVTYLAPSWARLCDVWDLIDVAIDRRDMWLTPIAHCCNNLIDTLVVDVCDTLTESADVVDHEQPTVETHIKNLDLISPTYYIRQVNFLGMWPLKSLPKVRLMIFILTNRSMTLWQYCVRSSVVNYVRLFCLFPKYWKNSLEDVFWLLRFDERATRSTNLQTVNFAHDFSKVPARYIIAFMGGLSLALQYALNVNMSVAIVAMVKYTGQLDQYNSSTNVTELETCPGILLQYGEDQAQLRCEKLGECSNEQCHFLYLRLAHAEPLRLTRRVQIKKT